jgi:hypothetical protein
MAGGARAWVAVSGQTTDGTPRAIIGEEALRTVYFDPTFARIELDSTVAPPRVVVSAAPAAVDVVGLIVALTARVAVLEAKAWAPTSVKIVDYTAVAWQHVYVNLGLASADVTIAMPTSPAPTVGDRVRVTETSPGGGGASLNLALKISCSFAPIDDGYYAASPYIVADNAASYSLEGATIELEYVTNQFGSGWLIVSETCRPEPLI